MGIIYAIRHGQASFGGDNYDRLSPLGVRQAGILGGHFARVNLEFEGVYHGTLLRQRQTAMEVVTAMEINGSAGHLPVMDRAFDEYDAFAIWKNRIPRLLEQDPSLKSDLEAVRTNPKAFQKIFERIMISWIGEPDKTSEEPDWLDFKARITDGLHRLMETHGPGGRIALFTSGGPISVLVQHALDLADSKAMTLSWQILNASVTRIRYGPGRISLAGFNDITHLEIEKDRTLLTYR